MIASIDHLVLTVADLEATLDFYTRILGMTHVEFNGRHAVAFGTQKMNLHIAGHEFEPKSARPTPGSADLCFLLDGSLENAESKLRTAGIEIEEGPVARTGAGGAIMSIYLRDPDQNLLELSVRSN